MIEIDRMYENHPSGIIEQTSTVIACMKSCFECAEFTIICADACLSEANFVELRKCIRLCLDCGEISRTLGTLLLRNNVSDWGVILKMTEVCERVANLCYIECLQHAKDMEHCNLCAQICHKCKESCKDLIQEATNLV